MSYRKYSYRISCGPKQLRYRCKYQDIFYNLPENVTPTIQGRDFVIATVAAPTVVKEPEKPAEADGEGGETTEAAADGEAKPEEGTEKAADGAKGKEEGKAPAEKK